MSKYLSGASSIDKAIQHTKYQNLDIISAGPIPPNPSELIISSRLASLIDELKKRYQVIIIDTPPLGLVSDTFMIMEYSDINLIVFRESHAKKEFVQDLDKFYKEHPEKKIGIILNGSHMESGSSYGYGGYGYGYGGYGYGHDEVK
jgi:capsular exopolysaccharide synthesis family protein